MRSSFSSSSGGGAAVGGGDGVRVGSDGFGGSDDLAVHGAHSYMPSASGRPDTPSYIAPTVSPPAVAARITSFKALKTEGDGNCLFHAIFKGLELEGSKSGIPTAKQLRAAACEQLQLWLNNGQEKYGDLRSGGVTKLTQEYINEMKKNATFAGNLEIAALVEKYQRPVVIITTPDVRGSDAEIQFSSIETAYLVGEETKIGEATFIQYDKGDPQGHYSAVQLPEGVTKQQFYEQLKEAQQANTQKAGSQKPAPRQ